MNRFLTRLPFQPLTLGLLAAGVLTLAGLGLLATRALAADSTRPPVNAAQAANAPKPALTVSVIQSHAGLLPIQLSANGNVMAWQEAQLGAEASGLRVQALHASVGDTVKGGQLLATFAAESVQADVALARAALMEATAHGAEAAANAERARALQNTGALSAQQISQYLTAEQTAKARIESAQAALDAQRLRLKQTQLRAPDSGIISARSASVGAVLGTGTEMFRLIRQGRLEWRGEVTSAELGRLAAGHSVRLTAPNGTQLKGRVRMVSPTVDPQTRHGLVYVDLPASSVGSAFKPGMYARGEFELGSSAAMTVAQTAVVVRDGFSYVYQVGPDHRVSQRKVQTGRRVGDQVEIVSGIQATDRLVASGGGFLSDGDVVKVLEVSTPNAAAAPVTPAQAATK